MLKPLLSWIFGPHIFELVAFFLAATALAMALSPSKANIQASHWFFGASFLMLLGRVIHWLVTSKDLSYPKPAIAAILFALIGGGWMIVYQWVEKQIRELSSQESSNSSAAAVLSPYARTESFIIDVPYYGGEDGFPVHALLDDEDYPLNDAYGCVASVLALYAQPGSTQINQIATLDTNDKRAEALVQSLRYCIIEQIHQSERGSSKFGISVTKGSIAEYKPALLPPDSTDYPPQKFLTLLGALPFGNHPRIQMLYRDRPLRVPKGSSVEIALLKMDANDWVNHWILRIKKPTVFSFTVGVAPINAAVGVLPESFPERYKAQRAKYVTYSFAITMKIEIERTPTNSPDVDDFRRWSDGIWAAIRDKYDVKRQK